MKTPEKHLYYLSELSDYKIAGGYPDVRNWEVKDKALRKIGAVKNLLVNKNTQRVVYLDVEVDNTIIDANHDPYGRPANSEIREFINEKGENHVIIPIGLVDLNTDQEYVFAEKIDHKTFAETKRIREDTVIERDYENAVLDSYGRSYEHTPVENKMDSDVENAEVYKEERMDKIKQRHNVGEYRDSEKPSKNIEEETEQYFDENETAKKYKIASEDEEFYGRNEFDDSRFYRGKK
ncbi:photosystem reaction center subunit H [Pricia sp.]|uniref:photosystem reaction center subunit H n=1 Tax=Pricia sp. TaxID=2268138 RepID=UPI0035940D6E